MIKEKFDAVIFDLDGTLVDSMWVWDKIDEAFLASHNIEKPNDMNEDLEGKGFTETAIYFKERFNLEMSVEEIKACWNEMAWDFYTHKVPLKHGVKEFLEWLSVQNIKMGIASSNSIELITAVLKALEVESYFTHIKTSCEVGKGKPFPDIYLKVAEELGVEPERCLVFEDIPNGVRAGKSAGMTVWAVEDGQENELRVDLIKLADRFVKDYYEAKAVLSAD